MILDDEWNSCRGRPSSTKPDNLVLCSYNNSWEHGSLSSIFVIPAVRPRLSISYAASE